MGKIIWSNKIKIFVSLFLVAAAVALTIFIKSDSRAEDDGTQKKKKISVKTQLVSESRSISGKSVFPATVASDQEIVLAAATGGIATAVNFDLGDNVFAGKLLVRIDDQGTAIGAGESGIKSGEIQQLEKALEIAEEAYDLAKDNYNGKGGKTDANKSAKDIAKLQIESAQIALDNAINSHLVTAPISGIVTSRKVASGDAVSAGQLLATISKTGKVKIQFFVDKDALPNISLNEAITVLSGKQEIFAKIRNIAPQADPITKRFLIEAEPQTNKELISGTVVSVSVPMQNIAEEDGVLILPLSAVTITQNENYIFIAENGKAKKISVEMNKISGETAEVKSDLSDNNQIIVQGNKLVQDGEQVEIAQ